MVFLTHYPSLLDEFDRNDNTYIIRNEDGISIENLASRFTRNDKLNLGEKVAVICEGGAETAIMEMLLDADRLIFTEDDLLYPWAEVGISRRWMRFNVSLSM